MASRKWAPISETLKEARIRRGIYLCASCNEHIPASIKNDKGRRIKNAIVDHIVPVIEPHIGWIDWNHTIDGMFCEKKNLQVVCYTCHKVKTDEERAIAKGRVAAEKLQKED